ncbi:MAG: type III restriction endonuclease subunit R, partial [Fimbriimonadales bacterium]
DELCEPDRILHIDSKVLADAEAREEDDGEEKDTPIQHRLKKAEQAELLRQMVDTVGKVGQPGEKIQNVISVGMLSEGWDAKTVTHIMGLRAFTSQLLCEQVVGRGLRRTAYEINPETGLLEPEYVNIFGVPFTFLPHEGGEDTPPPPPTPKIPVAPDPNKAQYEIRWPNVVRIERVFQTKLTLDWSKVRRLELDAAQTVRVAELAPIIEGKPDVTKIERIKLDELARDFRTQRIIFETARDVFDQMKHSWRGNREVLLAQLVHIVEQFIRSDRIIIFPSFFNQDELRRRLIITLNMSRVVQHVWEAIRQENTERLTLVFDRDHPIRSTGDMRTWYTGKPCEPTKKSHINVCVYDSTWEASDAYVLDNSDAVDAWVKNDHLGFEILYLYNGEVRKYRPDFLVRLKNGTMLVLEVKGQETEQDQVKWRYLDEWIQAVNAHGGFGQWRWAVAKRPGEIQEIVHSLPMRDGNDDLLASNSQSTSRS